MSRSATTEGAEQPAWLRLGQSVKLLGDHQVLSRRKIGLLCSIKCPGSVILQTYDLMKSLRNESVTVISGFHSPMERECLNILLRGTCGVVVCPARSLPKRIPAEFKKPNDEGRLLLLSAFDERQNRATAETSARRNRTVAALSDIILVPYAVPGGKTEALCREFGEQNKQILNVGDSNAHTVLCYADCDRLKPLGQSDIALGADDGTTSRS